MSSKKKNSNYVTDKTLAKQADKERAALAAKKKKLIMTSVIAAVVAIAIIGGVIGVGFASGWFDYKPEATEHVSIVIKDYGSLHVELYGDDAPLTVDHFVELVKLGKYNYTSFYEYEDNLLYAGDKNDNITAETVKGEFSENGVDNKISLRRGIIAMSRETSGYDSATSQFFVVTKDSVKLNGKYAAFGRIDDESMEIIDKICEDMAAGKDAPTITSISTHTH